MLKKRKTEDKDAKKEEKEDEYEYVIFNQQSYDKLTKDQIK